MDWLTIVVNILVMIVILGVLISIHEAGHLAMAKMFHVYCFEYSIGFGPKLLHVRRKGGETYFSLRAFPLGGYVSMYGEPGAVPEGETEPPAERSLNSINKGKKCLVLVAGVTMNFLLGLVLIFISDIAFPNYYMGYGGNVTTSLGQSIEVDSVVMSYTDTVLAQVQAGKEADAEPKNYYLAVTGATIDNTFCRIVDSDVVIYQANGTPYNGGNPFVAIYYPSTLTKEQDLGDALAFYPVKKDATIDDSLKELGITNLPDFSQDSFAFSEASSYVDVDLHLMAPKLGTGSDAYSDAYFHHSIPVTTKMTYKDSSLKSDGAGVGVLKEWNGWSGAWQKWASDVPTACGAVVKGFISLFQPGGWNNISGVIGMTGALSQIESLGGVGYVFYFAGLLSINLAFFNLLPFPGLDGWQLLVTGVEAATRKKMPAKAQSIASIIGFVLLFGLMIAVAIKDIIALII